MFVFVMISLVALTCSHNIKQKSTTGRLAGRVLNENNGEPVRNATISILGARRHTETDYYGDYFINNIPIGIYDIEASKAGYKSKVNKNIQIGKNATSIANFELITKGSYSVHYNSSFEPHNDRGQIIGRVIDKTTREPIESATIHINHIMNKDALSDSNGEYNLTNIQPGVHNIQARAQNIGYWFIEAERIKVEKGTKTVVNFELVKDPNLISTYAIGYEISSQCSTAGKIQVRVTDKTNGEPLALTGIRLVDSEEETFPKIQHIADLLGNYVFDNITPGLYNVEAIMMGYSAVIAESVKVEIGKITIIDFKLAMQWLWID